MKNLFEKRNVYGGGDIGIRAYKHQISIPNSAKKAAPPGMICPMMEHRHGNKTFERIESGCGKDRRPVGCNCVAVSLLDVRAIAGIKHTAMARRRDTRKCERDLGTTSFQIHLRAEARDAEVKRQPVYPGLGWKAISEATKKRYVRQPRSQRLKRKFFKLCVVNGIKTPLKGDDFCLWVYVLNPFRYAVHFWPAN